MAGESASGQTARFQRSEQSNSIIVSTLPITENTLPEQRIRNCEFSGILRDEKETNEKKLLKGFHKTYFHKADQ